MAFQDHFSGHAADYAKFRPRYPAKLFADLASVCPERRLAWDCGTGNGQAAVELAEHFDRVAATDPSPQQIAQAQPHPRVNYAVAAECYPALPSATVDLVTVAQALHWFDRPAFFAEARRVLKPAGVIAVWCYGLQRVGEPFDLLLRHYYSEVVGPYWPPERRLVEQGYRTIEFPFHELSPPAAELEQDLSLDGLMNYLGTWSATKRYAEAQGVDPIPALERDLSPLWGDRDQPRRVVWPLSIRIGRNS